jgi:glyoxylase-like metal-dependent hydrolase (beta-lactamase superfamily II)
MDDYLDSLQRMLELRPERLYPGHFSPPGDPVGLIETYIAHRLERETLVLAAIKDGATTLDEIVATVYSDTPRRLHPIARGSALAHLVRLERGGFIDAGKDGWIAVLR